MSFVILIWTSKISLKFCDQNPIVANETRKLRGDRVLHGDGDFVARTRLVLRWNCVCKEDAVWYTTKLESERVFEILVGLNHELNDVRGRILDRKPLSSTHEVFFRSLL